MSAITYQVTDENTDETIVVSTDEDVEAALLTLFPGAPEDVLETIRELAEAMCARDYMNDHEVALMVRVKRVTK